ncbi:MAG: nucleoside triphosphate pyrophosphohydrolase [Rhodospirillaceae bacterium]|nr:nucleoside triphosphate pyrophosphohydrolase [Rhodospirillaceae bacterium]
MSDDPMSDARIESETQVLGQASDTARQMDRLLDIMAPLRDPTTGCPWDIEQDFETIVPYTIEEAYEVADAIARQDMESLRDELGDLLFQSVFHAQMATEAGAFTFRDVVKAISDKMERRHPHVFGNLAIEDAEQQSQAWEDQKAAERQRKSRNTDAKASILDDVPVALPALKRAQKLGKRMQRVGFDWPDTLSITEKIIEELDELRAELATGDMARLKEELGDLLFTVAQIGRRLGIDPEDALQKGNLKVEKRFRALENQVRLDGQDIEKISISELETYWQQAKSSKTG